MKTKKKYIAPKLTLDGFKAENGYASSGNPFSQLNVLFGAITGLNSGSMESFEVDQSGALDGGNINW